MPKKKPKTKKPTLSRTFNPTLLTNILIMLFIKKLKTYKNDIVLKLFYAKIFFSMMEYLEYTICQLRIFKFVIEKTQI
jgi:hypothetical protein